jgi:hypothetical protein
LYVVILQEVETAKAAEFEAVTKQLEASKQRCAALQNSTQGVAAQLVKLQAAARTLAKDYKAHRAQSRSQVAEMGQSIMTQYKPILVGKLKVRCSHASLLLCPLVRTLSLGSFNCQMCGVLRALCGV